MTFTPSGKHLIAGQWQSAEQTFVSQPAHGQAYRYACGTAGDIDAAVQAAEQAFYPYSATTRAQRAAFLHAIADEIDARGDSITAIGFSETGLPEARLIGERGRTCGQLRMFAEHILSGDYLDKRHDPAVPERQPLPRADLRLIQQPVGPVAVFGASNFPLAFSTAGGDTASALAAGCPVVVKGHPAHPGTAEIVAEAILAAIESCQMPKGVFSLVQDSGESFTVGRALVQHPLIKAVGFTGSLKGGRALFDLCAARPEPIPFFGELGSVNPMFLFPNALANRGDAIAQGWAGSLTMGAGQFCTNPGIAVLIAGEEADKFVAKMKESLSSVPAQTMLTDGIAKAYRKGQQRIAAVSGVQEVLTSMCDQRSATPYLYATTAKAWLANESLAEEVFGPLGMVVIAESLAEMLAVAHSLEGQLTCTLHVDQADMADAKAFMPVLTRKAGRVLANAFPTGVEVCDAMVHGGPYPASTNFGATSVGTMAIRRFLRPVCYQDIPAALLPDDLN
ncbi:aldehyde dehydrogenase (NADP(+)) [Maribrevibacterium harenarium]|uniref:Aldehyde dehydrogenase (NADP(+)) n=1 Tax=Maribrevibacterium harenarium TaxID=2589817 RepID=A0A501X4C2_9GAMM|nr:aldehyde dehydrogenase (NADP(+)) [Maribrevibacterium harenarium]TPE55267.1 aldehyde dehydrogenase (NADP(+)) [Maribrevibacterium harenarium]